MTFLSRPYEVTPPCRVAWPGFQQNESVPQPLFWTGCFQPFRTWWRHSHLRTTDLFRIFTSVTSTQVKLVTSPLWAIVVKYWNSSYSEEKTFQRNSFTIMPSCHLRPLVMIETHVFINGPAKGNLRSSTITNLFLFYCASMQHDILESRRGLQLISPLYRRNAYASISLDKRNTSLFELFLSRDLLKGVD